MRMRDRRGPLAVLALAAAYLAILGWAIAGAAHLATGTAAPAVGRGLQLVLAVNAGLLAWRLVWRFVATQRTYGWREGLWSMPRAIVANLIAMFAAVRAAGQYLRILAGAPPRWDKTAHVFPDELAAS